jgi:DNA-binding MarR family transcriptional regulator
VPSIVRIRTFWRWPMARPGHEIALALRAAYLALHRQTDLSLARHQVTADQFVVLGALADREVLSQRELATRTGSDPSTLRAMLVLLEAKRLVARRPHPTDRRARRVMLTAKGRASLERMWAATEPSRREIEAGLGPDDVKRFLAYLRRITVAGPTERSSGTNGR